MTTVRCPTCGQSVGVRVKGTLVTHYKRGTRPGHYAVATQCPASRTPYRVPS